MSGLYCIQCRLLVRGAESVHSFLNGNAAVIFFLALHSVVGHKAVIDATVPHTHRADVGSAKGLIKEKKRTTCIGNATHCTF